MRIHLNPTVVSLALLAVVSAPVSVGTAFAASFAFSDAQTSTQTLSGSQTGVITATGSLTLGSSDVPVTISGNNATLTNLGIISQTGSGRAVLDSSGVTGLIITNGSTTNSTASMTTNNADVIQMSHKSTSVTLNNYGQMTSTNTGAGGAQVVDFNGVTTGANTINNYSGALMLASEADAVRPGVNGVVYNAGTIKSTTSTGSSSDGVDAQNNTGVGITNDTGGLIEGARHGITGGPVDNATLFNTTVTNNIGATLQGDNGSGINLDGFNAKETATVTNHGTITGNGITGDGDGVDIDGLGFITNTGLIKSINAFSSTSTAQSEGISMGGGTVLNSGTIEGLVSAGNSNAVGRGISLLGNDQTTGGRAPLYGNATVTNQNGGLILGQSDSGIAVGGGTSGFTIIINNNAGGTIQGGGTANAAIVTGADDDLDGATINESGVIDGSSSGKAIRMGGGQNTVSISGGSASVLGSIDGGIGGANVLSIDPGAGNSFSFADSIVNFNLVDVYSGFVTLTGVSTYTGTTRISGGTLDLDGPNRVSASSALDLDGGTLEVSEAGTANGQTFACLALSDSSTIDLDSTTSLTFNDLCTVAAGETLAITDYLNVVSPDYAIRLVGDYSQDADFLSLLGRTTIDGGTAGFRFDGTYTDVFEATPEPATLGMIALGGLLLFAVRRRLARA